VRYGKRKRRKRAARRILETAARRLKRDGIHGPGIAALMAEAGLARRHRTAGRAAVREIGRA
jgi:AcrR family transcriptional regulator